MKKNRRLAPDINPIVAEVGTIQEFKKRKDNLRHFVQKPNIINNLSTTNFGSMPNVLDKQYSLHAGKGTYVISCIDELNKFEKGIYMCTVLVVVGRNRATGKNVSFVSHQYPGEFLNDKENEFISHLRQRLIELIDICDIDTIDAAIVGGQDYSKIDHNNNSMDSWYKDSVELLGKQVENVLNFKPNVIGGPKKPKNYYKELGADSFIFDNEKRKVYLIRPESKI